MFYKIKALKILEYLYNLIPSDHWTCNTQNLDFVEIYFRRTDAFKYSFFSYSISKWNKLDPDLCNAKSYSTFRKSLLKTRWPSPNHIYKTHDALGLKLLTRLRLGLSHLKEQRFDHNFDSCINLLCFSSLEVESIKHFFLHWYHYSNICKTLLNTAEMINESILNVNDDDLIEILIHGHCKFSLERNPSIIKAPISYIKSSKRFDKSFLGAKIYFFVFVVVIFVCLFVFCFFFCTIGFCIVQVLRFPYYFHNVLYSSPF